MCDVLLNFTLACIHNVGLQSFIQPQQLFIKVKLNIYLYCYKVKFWMVREWEWGQVTSDHY